MPVCLYAEKKRALPTLRACGISRCNSCPSCTSQHPRPGEHSTKNKAVNKDGAESPRFTLSSCLECTNCAETACGRADLFFVFFCHLPALFILFCVLMLLFILMLLEKLLMQTNYIIKRPAAPSHLLHCSVSN